MKTLIIILLVVLILIGAASSLKDLISRGSGQVITETRDVSGYEEVSLSGVGNLEIIQDGSESLEIEAEDNILPRIETRVSGRKLEINYKTSWIFGPYPTRAINYTLHVKNLNKISLSGSGSIKSDRIKTERLVVNISGAGKADIKVEADSLESSVTGSGDFTMAGTVNKQQIEISGSGKYAAADLASRETVIRISGAGQARVDATEKLTVNISGSGRVDYTGDAEVNQNISGSGKVNKLPKQE